MSNQELINLFAPGSGGMPPYMAGRKEEQELFRNCVRALNNRLIISQDIILYGPRGNGKTTLLTYLEKETLHKEGPKLDIQWITPETIETPAEFANTMTGKKTLLDGFKKLFASVGLSSTKAGFEYEISSLLKTAEDRIKKQCKKKPLILIIDEAHTLKTDVGRALLNTSQKVRRGGHPFLLVMAGTPTIKTTLAKADSSFWERNERILLGRLSPEEARQAITVPLEKAGVTFVPGAAEIIVANTHCYPYFTQIWGRCLARRIHKTGAREITVETVKEVEAEANTKCRSMYQDRLNEIENMKLLAVAESVAHAFIQSGKKQLNKSTLYEAIKRGMEGNEPNPQERIMEKREQLLQMGFVWQNDPAGHYYEPGIPSLMSYVREHTLAQKSVEAVSKADTATAPPVVERVKRSFKDRRKEPSKDFEM